MYRKGVYNNNTQSTTFVVGGYFSSLFPLKFKTVFYISIRNHNCD